MSNENWSHNYWTGVSPSTLWADLKSFSLTKHLALILVESLRITLSNAEVS
jgi:hypothetical protein